MRALSHWDVAEHAWVVEPGEFQVEVGFASDDLPLVEEIVWVKG